MRDSSFTGDVNNRAVDIRQTLDTARDHQLSVAYQQNMITDTSAHAAAREFLEFLDLRQLFPACTYDCACNRMLRKLLGCCGKCQTVLFGELLRGINLFNLQIKKIYPTQEFSEKNCLALAAAAEQLSQHPVARAIVSACREKLPKIEEFEEFPGRGVRARIGDHVLLVGNRKLMVSRGVKGLPDIDGTVVYIACEGAVSHTHLDVYKRQSGSHACPLPHRHQPS